MDAFELPGANPCAISAVTWYRVLLRDRLFPE